MTAYYPIANGTTAESDGYFAIPGNFTPMFVPGFQFVAVFNTTGSPVVSTPVGFKTLSSTYSNGVTLITPNLLSGSPPPSLGTGSPSGVWVTLVGGAYELDYTDPTLGSILVNIAEVNSDTSLKFPGRASLNHGELLNENLLHLLENFSYDSAPVNPVIGQLWYNKSNETFNVFTGGSPGWKTVVGGKSYDEFILGGSPPSQVINTTNVNTIEKTSTISYQQVFLNGILQREGSTGNYTVTGANQITFSIVLNTGDEVIIYQL